MVRLEVRYGAWMRWGSTVTLTLWRWRWIRVAARVWCITMHGSVRVRVRIDEVT